MMGHGDIARIEAVCRAIEETVAQLPSALFEVGGVRRAVRKLN